MLNAFSAARYMFFINGLVNIANTSLIDVYVVRTTNLQVLDAQEVEWIMCQMIPNMILIEIYVFTIQVHTNAQKDEENDSCYKNVEGAW